MGTGSFPGVKRPGRGVDHPSTSSAEVEGGVELYFCNPLGAFVGGPSVNFFTFNNNNNMDNKKLKHDYYYYY